MEGWGEVTRLSLNSSISSVKFDSHHNLIWTGDADGYLNSYTPVTDYSSLPLYSYTKFRSSVNDEISQVFDINNHICSMSRSNINLSTKRGMAVTNLNRSMNENYHDFNCMTVNELNNEVIVNNPNNGLFKVNFKDPKSFTSFAYDDELSFINHQAKFLTLGKKNGSIDIFDQSSNKVIKEFAGHSDGITDMDVQGNYLVSSGFSMRHNNYFVDPLVNLYDLRMMKLLSPIPFPLGPSLVKFHPKLPNMILIGSKSGHLQFLDIFNQANFQLYQTDLMNNSNFISNLQFSSNGEFISFNDNYNNLILWSFNNSSSFNNFAMDLDHPNQVEEPTRNIPVEDNKVPLNVIGMPYYKDLLLSNYGSNLIFNKELAKLPITYNPGLPRLKFMDNMFDSNFNNYYSLKENEDNYIPFISENTPKITKSNFFNIPDCYSKLLIKYSKFGIEDFNFNYFNKTEYSGLENNLDNSYLNSLLQLYKYQTNFQNLILKNLAKEWLPNDADTVLTKNNYKGSSVVNELGYLYDMLNKTEGKNFRASNFSEFLNIVAPPELLNTDELKTVNSDSLKRKIITFNNYFIHKLGEELHEERSFFQEFAALFNIKFVTGNQLMITNCINIYSMDNNNFGLIDYLNYLITDIVELPTILSINLNFNNRCFKQLEPNWLPEFIHIHQSQYSYKFTNQKSNSTRYRLLGYVAEISTGPETSIGKHNLVSFILIQDKWYLFNDFMVIEIDKREVFNFKKDNKKMVVLLYENIDTLEPIFKFNQENMNIVNQEILYRDHFALDIKQDYVKQYRLLTQQDPPKPGSLIAIDAEFVVLQNDLMEINSTGTKTLIRPKKLSLARLSVIDEHEVPFIDDYVIHSNHIEDYITSFSGIEPGDLSPTESKKNLVTHQTCYRRLWLLLNLGCNFVGHGLQNDFRTINLHVPKSQIRDTSDLFFLPDFKRKLSLKFLSYVVLNEQVQVGNHDSIEDAKFALRLYKAYLKLKQTNQLNSTLDHIYTEGQRLKFRVPDS